MPNKACTPWSTEPELLSHKPCTCVDQAQLTKMRRQDISQDFYSLLRNSQPTTAFLARSFSMLKKLLAKDRNFESDNVQHYSTWFHTLIRPPGDWLAVSCHKTYFATAHRLVSQFSLRKYVFPLVNVRFTRKSQEILRKCHLFSLNFFVDKVNLFEFLS